MFMLQNIQVRVLEIIVKRGTYDNHYKTLKKADKKPWDPNRNNDDPKDCKCVPPAKLFSCGTKRKMIGLPDVRSLKINEVAKTSGANGWRLLLECPLKRVKNT
jgi:hypothetical protein